MSANWRSTHCFRQYRVKHSSLSRLYWTFELGKRAIEVLLTGKQQNEYAVDIIGPNFHRSMLPEKISELVANMPERSGVERLHLLVIAIANLEAYLQDAVTLHVASLGYSNEPNKLDAVGSAIAFQVAERSSIPSMLSYVEALLKIDFGNSSAELYKAYKLRCAAAHNGGFADQKLVSQCQAIGLVVDSKISITWPQLMIFLAAIDDVASAVDQRISTRELLVLETKWYLVRLRDSGLLPNKKVLWKKLHELGMGQFSTAVKTQIIDEIYQGKRP